MSNDFHGTKMKGGGQEEQRGGEKGCFHGATGCLQTAGSRHVLAAESGGSTMKLA